MKKLPLLLALCGVAACTPAIIGASVALGGATVAVSYETLGKPAAPACDAGAD